MFIWTINHFSLNDLCEELSKCDSIKMDDVFFLSSSSLDYKSCKSIKHEQIMMEAISIQAYRGEIEKNMIWLYTTKTLQSIFIVHLKRFMVLSSWAFKISGKNDSGTKAHSMWWLQIAHRHTHILIHIHKMKIRKELNCKHMFVQL